MTDEELKYSMKEKLNRLSTFAWQSRIHWENVEEWLSNFDGKSGDADREQLHMLNLLSQFSYFGDREVKEMLKSLYRDHFKTPIVHDIRKQEGGTRDRSLLERKFNLILERTLFFGMGNPSESGNHLLYYFRQENDLAKTQFGNSASILDHNGDLANPQLDFYVFLDDLCASGTQAKEYSGDIVQEIKAKKPSACVYYLCMCATTEGLEVVRNETAFDEIRTVFEFDETFRVFGDNSRYYVGGIDEFDKTYAYTVVEKYGRALVGNDFLGYAGNQLLLSFYHNTPDNTLPIIWFDEAGSPWVPIFPRHQKI